MELKSDLRHNQANGKKATGETSQGDSDRSQLLVLPWWDHKAEGRKADACPLLCHLSLAPVVITKEPQASVLSTLTGPRIPEFSVCAATHGQLVVVPVKKPICYSSYSRMRSTLPNWLYQLNLKRRTAPILPTPIIGPARLDKLSCGNRCKRVSKPNAIK